MHNNVKLSKKDAPPARQLLFNLLLAANHEVLAASEAVQACALFGISQNNARVALTRLVAEGLLEPAGRAEYRLGSAGRAVGGDVVSWRESERVTRPWDGGWVTVSLAGVARGDRTALRRRERALALVGLRELDTGLFVRPDNFAAGVGGTRERLYSLGLEQEAPVFVARELDAQREAKARGLWDGRALANGYRESMRKLEQSLARLAQLSIPDAAREAFLLGDQGIRQLVFDPLLPEPLVDAGLRSAFAQAVRRYDAAGTQIWARFLRRSAEE